MLSFIPTIKPASPPAELFSIFLSIFLAKSKAVFSKTSKKIFKDFFFSILSIKCSTNCTQLILPEKISFWRFSIDVSETIIF